MAESTLVPLIGASTGIVGVATLAFAVYARNRPRLVEGPLLMTVAVLGMLGGLAVVLLAEAAHGAGNLLYVGGVVCLIGVAVLTGAIAALPHPEGDAEAGH